MLVTTYTGKKVERQKCKRIKGNYYLVGDPKIKDSGECYIVEGKYHRFNNGYIEYDHEKGEYVLVHKNTFREGIVDFDSKGIPITGMFTPNIGNNIQIVDDSSSKGKLCISEEVAKKGDYRERFQDGKFYPKKMESANWFSKIGRAPISKSSLQYESRFVSDLTQSYFQKEFNPDQDNIHLNAFGDFLQKNGITFGLEFETTRGYIPERLCYKYGLIPLRDGSIEGLEYVTVPMSGRQGLYAVREICKELSKRTKFDHTCALHLHLGGIKRDEKHLLSMFILTLMMQDELFSLQPKYKKNNPGASHGGFCKPLASSWVSTLGKRPTKMNEADVKNVFSSIFEFISDGRSYGHYSYNLDNVGAHPSDPNGNRKWNINSRYFITNFVPIIFGNKKTVEFRQHHITHDFEKVIQFLFNCAVIINTVQTSSDQLLNSDSELMISLMKKPNLATSTLCHNLLKQEGNTNLLPIVRRHENYLKVRKEIMEILDKSNSLNESRHDKKYDEVLEANFW